MVVGGAGGEGTIQQVHVCFKHVKRKSSLVVPLVVISCPSRPRCHPAPWRQSQPSSATRPHGASERDVSQGGLRGDGCVCCGWATDQHRRGHEQVIEGVVQQVEAAGGVQVRVTHQLAGEQRLSGAAAQETPHLSVGHVHPVGQQLQEDEDTLKLTGPARSLIAVL